MNTQTQTQAPFTSRLEARVGELVDRAASVAPGKENSTWMRWVLVAVGLFFLWRIGRFAKSVFWTLFGIGVAFWWTGGAVWFFQHVQ